MEILYVPGFLSVNFFWWWSLLCVCLWAVANLSFVGENCTCSKFLVVLVYKIMYVHVAGLLSHYGGDSIHFMRNNYSRLLVDLCLWAVVVLLIFCVVLKQTVAVLCLDLATCIVRLVGFGVPGLYTCGSRVKPYNSLVHHSHITWLQAIVITLAEYMCHVLICLHL